MTTTHLQQLSHSTRSPNKLVIGLIGAGGISQSQHLPNLCRAKHIELRVVCDLDADRLAQMTERFGIVRTTTKYREVLADPEIDAVLIATRPDSHVPLTLQALAAGKHVYVEKPLAETVQQCQQVTAAQRAAGRRVAIGFNRRMAPAYRRAKQLIDAHNGARNIHYRVSDAYWIWGHHLPPGERVIHEVCHIIDLLRHLTGSEVQRVYCVQSRPDDEAITLQFKNGCVATIMSSGYVHYDMPKESLEVIVERGAITVSDFTELRAFGLLDVDPVERFAGHTHPDRDHVHQNLFRYIGEPAMLALRRDYYETSIRLESLADDPAHAIERRQLEHYLHHHAPLINYMMDKGWQQAMDHFAESILKNEPCELSDAEDGLRVAQITEAVIRSRETGQVQLIENP